MSAVPGCPGIDCWRALLAASLAPDEQEQFERHLESCPVCQEHLDHIGECGDNLLGLARRFGDPTTAPLDPTLSRILERLHGVRSPERTCLDEPVDLYFLRPTDKAGLLGTLGDYEVQEVIGQGGFGIVLKAYEPALHRLVAIKVLSPALAGSATARRRFTRETQAAAAVCHDHVVAVHGVSETDGLPYLVMQYVPGESLESRLARTGPLELTEIVRIGMQTASGLAAAHAQGLIHRDIKPANLLLENGLARVKITDFGLARMADDVGLTRDGTVAGTPEYMAPEQARGEAVDHRADLFSLGSVLYAMCVGFPPFRGSTTLAVLRQVSESEPAPIRSLNPNMPAWLETLVSRLLAKDPDQRFQSAAEVAALLEGYLAHLCQPGTVPAPNLPSPLALPGRKQAGRPWTSGGPWLLLASGILGLLAVLGGTAATLRDGAREAAVRDGAREPEALVPKPGLVCLLVNKKSGRCLSVANQATNGGAIIVQGPTPDQAGVAERWVFLSNPDDTYRLLNSNSRLVMEIGRANQDKGVHAIQWNDQALPHQRWSFEPVDDGYVLRVQHSQQVLGIAMGLENDGAEAVQWDYIPGVPEEIWELRPAGPPAAGATASDQRALPVTKTGAKGWQVALVLVAGLALSLLLLGGWVYSRRNRRKTPAPAAATDAPTIVSFACPECGSAIKAKADQAGRKGKCPRCGFAVLVPDARPTTLLPAAGRSVRWKRWLMIGAALLLAAVVVGGSLWVIGPGKGPAEQRSFLNVTVGNQEVAGVAEAGFSYQEFEGDRPFRWTDGKARLVIPLREGESPRALKVHLKTTPQPNLPKIVLKLVANDRELFNDTILGGDWERTFDLGGTSLGQELALDVISDTFCPLGRREGDGQVNDDPRTLGVQVLGVQLLEQLPGEGASFLNVTLGPEAVPGVAEQGFFQPEQVNGRRFRWTDGHARMEIPVRKGDKPRALQVKLSVWRTEVRRAALTVQVNGRELFTGDVGIGDWERAFDLGGIDLGEKLVLELVSDTFSPLGGPRVGLGPGKSDDARKLGVQVRGIRLLPAMPPPQQPVAPVVEVNDPALTIWRGHPRGVSCGAVSADGWTLVSGSWDGTVLVWDVLEGGLRKSYPRLMPRTAAVAVHPDGKTFAASSNSQLVHLWDAETGKERGKLVGPGLQVLALAYSPDGTLLAAAGGVQGQPGELMLWDAATGKQRDPIPPFPLRLWDVAFSPDGKRVVVAGEDGTASVVDAGSGKVVTSFPHPAPARRLALSPDGRRLAVAYGNEGLVRMYDLDTGKPLADLRAGGQAIRSLQFSPSGKRLLTACRDGTVRAWDVSRVPLRVAANVRMHPGNLWFGLLFPDGKTVATGGEDGTIRLRKLDGIE